MLTTSCQRSSSHIISQLHMCALKTQNFKDDPNHKSHTGSFLPFRLLDSLLSCASTKTWKQGRHLAAASGSKDRSAFELVEAQSLVVRNTTLGGFCSSSRRQTLRRYRHRPRPALSTYSKLASLLAQRITGKSRQIWRYLYTWVGYKEQLATERLTFSYSNE